MFTFYVNIFLVTTWYKMHLSKNIDEFKNSKNSNNIFLGFYSAQTVKTT